MPFPCWDTYGGTKPFSVPCTRNVKRALLLLGDRLELFIDLHTFGEDWLTPYAADVAAPSDNATLVSLYFTFAKNSHWRLQMCSNGKILLQKL